MIQSIVHTVFATIFAISIPTFLVLGLTFLNRNTKKILVQKYGFNSQIYLGFFGIMIHEISHFIFALVFFHQIQDFKFIVLPHNVRKDNALGYVKHSWNSNSFWQNIGNLFIGTAPIYGCTAVIYLVIKYLIPEFYQNLLELSQNLKHFSITNFFSIFSGLDFTFSFKGILLGILALIIILNITIGGFDLSNADLMNSKSAFFVAVFIILSIAVAATCIGLSNTVISCLLKFAMIFVEIMSISLILSFITNLLIRMLKIWH